MSDSVTTGVEVAVSPDVAFDVFTSEIDAWYRVDADTLPDITRTAAIRFEPRAGGRLLDVHDPVSGTGRELGRITAWEPGRRLAFADNEGTEVDVRFEPCRAGTRVTLTHRGLDRLAPERARELRRGGWAALAPFYRDHVAPNARPVVATLALNLLGFLPFAGVMVATALVGDRLPSWAVGVALGLTLGTVIALPHPRRFVRRWVGSDWRFRRISLRLLGLAALWLFIGGIYDIVAQGRDALEALWIPSFVLFLCWTMEQEGPARGRSLRGRAGSAERASDAEDASALRPIAPALWFVVGLTLLFGLLAALESIDALDGLVLPALVLLSASLALHSAVSGRRESRGFGFDPDLYLAVARPVSESGRPPELLVHQPSGQPEYSGWYAYASGQDYGSDDFVVWSMRDLVDHSPETIHALREGHGEWRWDHARRAYLRIEQLGGNPRPA